jgi:hypothetical protein
MLILFAGTAIGVKTLIFDQLNNLINFQIFRSIFNTLDNSI